MTYRVTAADRAGCTWDVYSTENRAEACRVADAHRTEPYGYVYGVWDDNRDRWDSEDLEDES